ncbi:MAG: tandem-95 repeat protein, partial [Gammaproteobacteria bacterium]|nr:tandem-95 repeat protein [Gammaproteobacteria bacterium]
MKLRCTFVRLSHAAVAALLVAGCGGGGGSGSPATAPVVQPAPPPVSGVQITGTAMKGALEIADVDLIPIDIFGNESGPAIVSVVTDSNGNFNATIPPGTGDLLVRTRGGSYVDEADREPDPARKRRIVLGPNQGLESILPAGETVTTVTLASQALVLAARRETIGGTFMQQFEALRAQATGVFGFDAISTVPANPVTPDPATADAQRQYALLLGGLANVVNRVAVNLGFAAPTPESVFAVAEDLSDGRIDGTIDGDPVLVGNTPIGAFDLNEEIVRFRNNNFDNYASTGIITVDENALSQPPDPVNAVPAGLPEDYTLAVGETLSVPEPGVLENDTDGDGNPLFAVLVTGPANAAQFGLADDGSFDYVHDGSAPGVDTFTYVAFDGIDESTPVTVTLNVTNIRPVANDDVGGTVDEGGTFSGQVNLLDNDTDVDGDPLTAVLADPPANGQVFVFTNGTFEYNHDGGETTADSFTYVANDGFSDSDPATVTITINPVNDPPVANPDAITVDEGQTGNLLLGGATSVLANDVDPDSQLTATLESPPVNGQLTFNADGTFEYSHDGSETTSDSFDYSASDGIAAPSLTTVTINILPVNDPPFAEDDSIVVDEGATATLLDTGDASLLDNDFDPDGDPLTVSVLDSPANGQLTVNPDGTFSYAHDGSETVEDQFTYVADDGTDNSAPATVGIAIIPVNDPPDANDDFITVERGAATEVLDSGETSLLFNDTDAENDALTATVVTPPTRGDLNLLPNGTFLYIHDDTPETFDSFTYVANDGSDDSAPATVEINILNLFPQAVDDSGQGFITDQDVTFQTASVFANDELGDQPTTISAFDALSVEG